MSIIRMERTKGMKGTRRDRPARRGTSLTLIAAAAALATLLAAGLPARADREPGHHLHSHDQPLNWALHKESTLQRTFTLAAAGAGSTVEIDDFEGDVVVRGHAGNQAALRVHQAWHADSAGKLEQAQREVRLDVTQDGSRLRLYVDGPFRSRDGGTHFDGWRELGYQARFDVEIEVPAGVELIAKTVNHGEVRVAGVDGRFDAANVNGPVTLEQMSGSGSARSVNGEVRVAFSRNPAAGCTFKTVNGRIDVSFRPGFAGDLSFQTLNGEVYTDFPYSPRALPAATAAAERGKGRYRYHSRGEFAARIGDGGPALSFSTINGDILIRRQDG